MVVSDPGIIENLIVSLGYKIVVLSTKVRHKKVVVMLRNETLSNRFS